MSALPARLAKCSPLRSRRATRRLRAAKSTRTLGQSRRYSQTSFERFMRLSTHGTATAPRRNFLFVVGTDTCRNGSAGGISRHAASCVCPRRPQAGRRRRADPPAASFPYLDNLKAAEASPPELAAGSAPSYALRKGSDRCFRRVETVDDDVESSLMLSPPRRPRSRQGRLTTSSSDLDASEACTPHS